MATPSLQAIPREERRTDAYRVLGVRVDAVQIGDVIKKMEEWIERREAGHTIAVTGMHGVMEARHDEEFGRVLEGASLVVPDGYPLVVLGRSRGFALARRFKGMEIAGTYCPPFRQQTAEEEREICEKIRASRADVVWVGLSTPKQERWIARMRDELGVPVMVGVGAAFDFHTGRVAQAPRWMRENGME